MLFCELPFLARFEAAARAGFDTVEFLFPYEYGIDKIRAKLDEFELTVALFDIPLGDAAASEVGTLCCPSRRDYFRWSFETALDAADRLGCGRINVLFGNREAELEPAAQMACAVENLRWAAPQAQEAGVVLLLEPISDGVAPRYFLRRSSEAMDVIRTVGQPQVRLQYDVYHAHIVEGDLTKTVTECFEYIGHIQIGDVPGRGEPGTGEIDYPGVFAKLEELGYQGYIGLEYHPTAGTIDSLAWLPEGSRGLATNTRRKL